MAIYAWVSRVVQDTRLGDDFYRPSITRLDTGPLEWVTMDGGPSEAIAVGVCDMTPQQAALAQADPHTVVFPADQLSVPLPGVNGKLRSLFARDNPSEGEDLSNLFDRVATRIGNRNVNTLIERLQWRLSSRIPSRSART